MLVLHGFLRHHRVASGRLYWTVFLPVRGWKVRSVFEIQLLIVSFNRPFPSFFKSHNYESEAKCKVLIMKIRFHSYVNKTNFHMKNFALSLTFITRFTTAWKWPI